MGILGGIINGTRCFMKRLFVFSILIFLVLTACAQGDLPETASSEAVSQESIEESSTPTDTESSEESGIYLDIATELLPLLDSNGDAEYEDKINDFLNFIYENSGDEGFDITPLYNIYLEIKRSGYYDGIWEKHTGNSLHVWRSLYLNEKSAIDNIRIISLGDTDNAKETTITFGGDVCFGDNYATMPYLLNRKDGILSKCIAQEWIDFMNDADISTLNNEFAISSRGEPMKHKAYTYLAKPEHTKYYNEMGIDFVTLANNHVYDFGEDAFFDTMSTLDEYGIDYAGAGKNASDAQKPFYYIVNGRKIAFISATRAEKNILTPEATEEQSGVFRCYEPERLLEVIEETKRESDFVILFVHWGTENSDKLERVQKITSHQYVDAGADLIIGTHAHQLQGIEYYNGKAIFYNLGNFWFNAKNIETGQVKLVLDGELNAEYYFIPAMQSGCKVSYELGTARGREILDHISSYEPSDAVIEDDGHIIFKATEEE